MSKQTPDTTKKSPEPVQVPPELQPGAVYEIPPEGSLGLLALGAVGLRAWREKRDAVKATEGTTNDADPAG